MPKFQARLSDIYLVSSMILREYLSGCYDMQH